MYMYTVIVSISNYHRDVIELLKYTWVNGLELATDGHRSGVEGEGM